VTTKGSKGHAPGTQPALGGDWAADQAKVANISELSRASGKDRATVKKLLVAAGLQPKFQRAKETFYDLKDATEALSGGSRDTTAPLTHARTQKTTAEAARIVLKLQRERGELAPRSEFREEAFNLVKAMHTRLTRYAKSEAWNRLRKAKNRGEFERTMSTDVALIFDDLKRDYPEIL
jgi:hypothetical protein